MKRYVSFYSAAAVALVLACLPSLAQAQASKSAPIAKELVQVMDAKKLDSIAAKIATPDGTFAAALYFPNVQLLVISGLYSAPQLMEPRLAGKQYRDTYMELSGTVSADSKIFVQDMGEPGRGVPHASRGHGTGAGGTSCSAASGLSMRASAIFTCTSNSRLPP